MLNVILSEKPWHKDMAQNLKDAPDDRDWETHSIE